MEFPHSDVIEVVCPLGLDFVDHGYCSILSEDVESLKTVDKKYDAALGLAIKSIVLSVFVAEMIVNKDLCLHFRFRKLS